MHDPRNIAKAYMIESEVDIKMARLAFWNSFYSRCLFFSQQASDKAVRACLVMNGVVTKDQIISPMFKVVFRDNMETMGKIVEAIEHLERYGAKARLPLFQREDLPIWIPSQSIKDEDAKKCLEKGELIFNTVKDFLAGELERKKE